MVLREIIQNVFYAVAIIFPRDKLFNYMVMLTEINLNGNHYVEASFIQLTKSVRYDTLGMFWLVTNRKLMADNIRINDSCSRFWVSSGFTAKVEKAKILSKF